MACSHGHLQQGRRHTNAGHGRAMVHDSRTTERTHHRRRVRNHTLPQDKRVTCTQRNQASPSRQGAARQVHRETWRSLARHHSPRRGPASRGRFDRLCIHECTFGMRFLRQCSLDCGRKHTVQLSVRTRAAHLARHRPDLTPSFTAQWRNGTP